VRYADDFVVMCRKDVEEPLKVVRHVLERLGLSLNESKTRIVDATEASFNSGHGKGQDPYGTTDA